MAVYVDDMRAEYGRMKMSHMIADTSEELFMMAILIGLALRWCQNKGTYREHFDVCLEKRRLAISMGAVEITQKELARKLIEKRKAWTRRPTTGSRGSATR